VRDAGKKGTDLDAKIASYSNQFVLLLHGRRMTMARLRFVVVALLALALAGNSTQTGRSAGQNGSDRLQSNHAPQHAKVTGTDDCSCVIYSLGTMGYDADLGQWIAQTIPVMVEPSSWQELGGPGALRYYAPKNILIIKNSAAVHAKVDGFLKDLKTSLPRATKTSSTASQKSSAGHVVSTAYNAPAPIYNAPAPTHASSPVPEPSSYPVPAPVKTPKHLFHFLIRYEGEGIIDDNVVRFMKAQNQPQKDKTDKPADQPPVTSSYAAPSVGNVAPSPAASPVPTPTPSAASSLAAPVPLQASGRSVESPKKKKDKNDDKEDN
jgi:hypothetical protein